MIKREQYLEKLRKLRDLNVIKVITGIRRSGKSTLFRQFREELIESGVKEKNIIYLNLEEMENESLLERHLLNDYIMKMVDKNVKNYVFLDEIQNVPNFEKLVDSLFVKENIDLYITGSNAYMLSSEIATVLSGRYVEIRILPFSFAEFSENFPDSPREEVFAKYLKFGGFPEVSNFLKSGAESEVGGYLNNIYSTVFEKDIMRRRQIRLKHDFVAVMQFAFDSVGSLVSPNNIANTLTNNGNVVNKATVESFLLSLTESFVLYKARRFDVKGKKLLQTIDKYYGVDSGLMNYLSAKSENIDRGHMLENVVYLELLRRNKQVWVGKVDEKEVDFVVETLSGEIEYYQIAETIVGEEVRRRELAVFDKIRDHHAKYVLTLDYGEEGYSGVRRRNVLDWLVSE